MWSFVVLGYDFTSVDLVDFKCVMDEVWGKFLIKD